jgi:hypothetical protein
MTRGPRSRTMRFLIRLGGLATLAVLATGALASAPQAAGIPATPAGTTGIALDGKVALAWKASADATGYAVYRGASAATITTLVSPAEETSTSFTDTTAVNGTTYFYAVRATSDLGSSDLSQIAKVTPVAASCSTGNAIARENCFPGTTAWKGIDNVAAYPDGIEGFASASSVDAGGSVDVRVQSGDAVPYRVEIYRTGWYGGDQGRLVGTLSDLTGEYVQGCYGNSGSDPDGLVDCSAWPASFTLTTGPDWTSGVYLLKLIREDNGHHSEVLLVVRHDGSTSDALYHVPTNTYLAYNSWFGKSLYTSLSDPPVTTTGTNRAAKVSLDRPFAQATSGPYAHDYYTRTDVAAVGWLEREGYDVTYVDSAAFDADGAQLQHHHAFISGAHDEYWSQAMRDAAAAARDSGTSLFFLGANAAYWKVRYEASPMSSVPRRVMVSYKTIESGPADPSGVSTSTWRDPAGPNQPENALIGQMYVGENLGTNFPLSVSAAQGKNRIWRYTSAASQAPGATALIGSQIVGWEWDSTVDNGLQPAGLQTVAATPVDGNLSQGNGASVSVGSATQKSTLYTTAGGATVFATGTNNWWRGLAKNIDGAGEPSSVIQQATANVLGDMGVVPTTPSGVQVDAAGAPAVTSTTPANGAGAVSLTADVTFSFDQELDPSTIDDADVTLAESGAGTVAGTVKWDAASRKLTFEPADALEPFTGYTATLGTGVKTWSGQAPSAPLAVSYSTGPGTPPVITVRTPAAGAGAVPTDTAIVAHFDRRLDPATVTGTTFSLRPTAGGGAIAASVAYTDANRSITLTPASRLAESTSYTVTATTGIAARGDGTPMAGNDSWSFTTSQNLKVSSTWPASGATGISPLAAARAAFSKAIDAAAVPAGGFVLRSGDGTLIPSHVSYDASDRTATLVPDSPLLANTAYTATVSAVHAADGAPVDTTVWTFTTASTPPPAAELTGLFPASAAVGVSPGATVRASFDIPIDAATVTAQNFTVTPDGGAPVAGIVSYDAAARKAILAPLASLAPNTHYTVALSTGIRTTTGAPLPVTVTWGFTTANCPCNLLTTQTPQWSGPVQDFRPGPGPFSYELGQKIQVTATSQLIALRYWKDATETGSHVGRVWNSAGTQIASATFQNESASGWQRQSLAVPVSLQPGQTYTISIGLHSTYVRNYDDLATQLVSGPLRSVADGHNGVYASVAGQFPSASYRNSNYFVDAVVRLPGEPANGPQVASQTPLAGATGVGVSSDVTATFAGRLDPSTVSSGSFTLTDSGGHAVAASVSYDDDTKTATLDPSGNLDKGQNYTAHLSTALRSEDEVAMAAAVSWTFATVPPTPPVVTQISPVQGATNLSSATDVDVTFDQAMSAASLSSSSFTLTAPGGSVVPATVSYDSLTRTATLHPTSELSAGTQYTAALTSAVTSSAGLALGAQSWTFTTSDCPCSLFGTAAWTPQYAGLSTANGRGAGPWSLEMGVKIQVDHPARLQAVRFSKDPTETGTHVARFWTGDGTLLGSVAFEGETSSGWQHATLATPLALTPGQTYVVSVGINAAFGMSLYAFGSPIVSGPLSSVADGQNGVYGDAAGAFPTQSWGSSNYGIDAVVN